MSWITINNAQRNLVLSRVTSGPYKSVGDTFAYSPAAYDDVLARAAKFMNDEVDEFWNGSILSDDNECYGRGHYMAAAGFIYMLTGDVSYANKVKTAILTQASATNPAFEDYYTRPVSGWSNSFHFCGLMIRIFHAFDYVKDVMTTGEIATVEAWFERAYTLWLTELEYYPKTNFPNRLLWIHPQSESLPAYNSGTTYNIGDQCYTGTYTVWQSKINGNVGNTPAANANWYQVTGNFAASGQDLKDDADPKAWTHKDEGGTFRNRILRIHYNDYNNQSALYASFCMLWSLYKSDAAGADRIKVYYHEYLMYGTFPDGMVAETASRNGDYGYAQQGCMWYSTIALEAFAYSAHLLAMQSDFSLRDMTTSLGLWGTSGGNKNLKLIADTLAENGTSSVLRYYDTVTLENRLDPIGTNAPLYRYKFEQALGVANALFKDAYLKSVVRTEAAGCSPYTATMGGPQYVSDARWTGDAGLLVTVPTMFYDTDGVSLYPAGRNVSKKMLMA